MTFVIVGTVMFLGNAEQAKALTVTQNNSKNLVKEEQRVKPEVPAVISPNSTSEKEKKAENNQAEEEDRRSRREKWRGSRRYRKRGRHSSKDRSADRHDEKRKDDLEWVCKDGKCKWCKKQNVNK